MVRRPRGGVSSADRSRGNTEFRSYQFAESDDENASVIETAESRERRRGTEKPLTEMERGESRQINSSSPGKDGQHTKSKF